MYFTVLLLCFQKDIWIQEYINCGIKATFQGSDMCLGMQKTKGKP